MKANLHPRNLVIITLFAVEVKAFSSSETNHENQLNDYANSLEFYKF